MEQMTGLKPHWMIPPFGEFSLLPPTNNFSDRFEQWKALASVRVVFALIGWTGYILPYSVSD